MERILIGYRRQVLAIVLVGVILITSIANDRAVAAGPFSGPFTGYAMGAVTSEAGVTISQGHFANHHYEICPNDPAAHWSYGTRITTSQWIGMKNYRGDVFYRNRFYLYDTGDYSCSEANYWVDIYFGRYRFSGDICSCPGVVNSVCTIANANSCRESQSFGRSTRTYTSP